MSPDESARLSRALAEIDIRIHSCLTFDEVMQGALEGFIEALNADSGDIKVIENGEWIVRYATGFAEQIVGLRLARNDAPIAELVAGTDAPVMIADLPGEMPELYRGFPRDRGLHAVMAMPLVVQGEIAGCLFAWMQESSRRFTDVELDFARRLAASVALALENSRLLAMEREARVRAEDAEARLGQELEYTRVLIMASDELTTTTDSDELLSRLATLVLEATGIDRAFINLINPRMRVLIPKIATGGLAAPHGQRIPFDELSETAQRAIAAKKTVLLDYELPDVPEADRKIARANAARLVLFVPLLYQGEVIGHLSLDQPGVRYEFTDKQIRIVTSIAAQAAVALHNARTFEREHRIAQALQEAVLAPPERIDALEVSYRYHPASETASVGGDFYDVFDLGANRAAIIIGDVAGKGIDAARLTTLMRDGARAYLMEGLEPAEAVSRLNALAHRFTPVDKFATLFLGVLNCATGELRHCTAGHPPPVVAGSGAPRLLDSAAGLVGAFADAEFVSSDDRLERGEVMCLYTDGIVEARGDGGMYGVKGIVSFLERVRGLQVGDLPSALLEDVAEFTGGYLRDDAVVLCVTRVG